MNIEDYVSGLGEVPDKACGSQDQVNQRPDKYALDDPGNIWDCWPEESIKAQVVAARSYALYFTSGGGSICTSAACQVYKGGEGKRWASSETSSEVMLLNGAGEPLGTYYHASARGHTENNEYVWTSRSWSANSVDEIKGWAKPHTRGKDDSAYSFQNYYYNWYWRTNSYSKEELSQIFARDGATDVGQISTISLSKGSSSRAWAVTLQGSSGTKYVAAWKFKDVFNSYIYSNYPPEKRAYLFSTEFDFLSV
jgi:SpoIID/LytB domain protein